MVNKGKKNRMRFFASCLAVAMCLSIVDTSLFFPVNAEGETTPVEQTPEAGQTDPVVETQPEETVPAEGTEPGTETPEPDVPAVEEQPEEPEKPVNDGAVQPEEEAQEPEVSEAENPDTISVQALEAKARAGEIRADDVITDFDVKDTEGNSLADSGITGIRLGWVRNAGLPEELELAGSHYTLKGVKVDDKECLYITKYNDAYYYSFDGESGFKVNDGQTFVVEYWQYYNVEFSGEDIDKLDVSVEKQELKYGDDTSLSLKSFASSPEKVAGDSGYRVYSGKKLNWQLYDSKDTKNRIEYKISSVLWNGIKDDQYAAGGAFSTDVYSDVQTEVNAAANSSPKVLFHSGKVLSSSPQPLTFESPGNTIQFSITLDITLSNDTVLVLDGETHDLNIPSRPWLGNGRNEEITVVNGIYRIKIKGPSSGKTNYDFEIERIDGNSIQEDLEFSTKDKARAFSTVKIEYSSTEMAVGILTDQNTVLSFGTSGTPLKLDSIKTQQVLFLKPQNGYVLNNHTGEKKAPNLGMGAIFGYGTITLEQNKLDEVTTLDSAIQKEALRLGYTEVLVINRINGLMTTYNLTLSATPIDAVYQISGKTVQSTNYRDKSSYILPTYNEDGAEFHGWKLNGNDQRLYQTGDTFELTDRTWNLGTLENPDDPNSTRIFNFEPVTGNEYYSYTIEHYLQNNNDGSYPTDPSEIAKGVSLQTSGSYVVGIPRVYSDHTFDSTVEGTKQGIDFSDSTDSRVIELYYRKNFQYANVQIVTHIDGKLADKNKKFTYTVKAEKEDAGNRIDPLKDDVFKSEGWNRDPDGNYYVKSFEHGAEEVYDLGNVPVTNCKYTVSLNGNNSFYETKKHTVVNGTETDPVSATSHTFTGSAMTPNATHEVHFTHTASDVVPAGNIFEDKGFDLMLATTAVLGLLCAVYAVFRRRMQIR